MKYRSNRLGEILASITVLTGILASGGSTRAAGVEQEPRVVDTTTLEGKVLCGYQGWFRCPGDAANMGWIHWSRDPARITPATLTFEMWPSMKEYTAAERYPAPGFTRADGRQAYLFSSDSTATVLRHFRWMRDYGIDGVWLQHFLVDLPGGPQSQRYPSRLRVLHHVMDAARQTGRTWALAYDIAGMPIDNIYKMLTHNWKRTEDSGVPESSRYLHDGGRPVVLIWGFYENNTSNRMDPALANRLIDFFKQKGRYSAYLVGGGDWNWRKSPDPQWRKFCHRFNAYVPWNVGNYSLDAAGTRHASTAYWVGDRKECAEHRVRWIPVVYPGFSWDNLKQEPPGTSLISRRGGQFLWEQFAALRNLNVRSVYVAMFDEVDEGTAIFKVTSSPPVQAHFVGYDGLPDDWYLRLVHEGIRMLRGERSVTTEIPIKP